MGTPLGERTNLKSPAFSLYVRDVLCSQTISKLHSKSSSKTHSRCLNAYWFLLCNAWLQEPRATLPDDDQELADLARVSLDEWMAIKSLVMPAFKQLASGRWFHERQMEESEKQNFRSKAGSKGGSKAAANRAAALEDAIAIEKEVSQEYHLHSRAALFWLNEKAVRKFRETDSNLSIISARLNEHGVTIDTVKQMVLRQCEVWKGDPKMEDYLRPETLFGKQKFDQYHGNREVPVTKHVNGIAVKKTGADKSFDRDMADLDKIINSK